MSAPDESPQVLVIGLTGGIASGKTAVSDRFAELGAEIVDTDVIAREIVEPGTPAYDEIIEHFGRAVLASDGRLDRAELRQRVFADTAEREYLESVTHPRIRAEAWRRIRRSQAPYVVLVVPLLVESGLSTQVDRILVVDCEPDTQLSRLLLRDAGAEETARAIIAAQADRDFRRQQADDLIVNDGTLADLSAATDALHEKYLALADRVRTLSRNGDETC